MLKTIVIALLCIFCAACLMYIIAELIYVILNKMDRNKEE